MRFFNSNGVSIAYIDAAPDEGHGDPILLIHGFASNHAVNWVNTLWVKTLMRAGYRVIAFDNRGLGGSERGEGPISVASMAEDASALLEALEVPRAHVMGWSLGSAVAQELALSHPEQVASTLMYATWGRCDGFQRSVLTALRLPYAVRDMEAALSVAGIAFSPQALDSPDLEQALAALLPAFPQDEAQMQVTVEQWDADLAHHSLDRLGGITAPTLVIVGEQDLLTPPWQSRIVAEAIPGARFELVEGLGHDYPPAFWDTFVDLVTEHTLGSRPT